MVTIGLFRRKKKQEIRADTVQNAETSILTFFGITGELTREAALSIPTVSACINKVGETISRLPVKLYRKDEEEVTEIYDDPRIKLLNGSTGDTLSTVDMWKAAVEDYYLGRGAWIYVNSDSLSVRSLHYVDSRSVSILCNTDPIFKAFRVQINAQTYYDFQFVKLLRKTRDGYTNIPLQEEASSILSAAWNALKLENMMNSSGGCKPGFLKSKNKLADAAIAAIKEGYQKVYDNEEKRDKIVVLNEGVDFEAISSTAAELQMNENKKTNSIEICKLFGFPHTVIDGGATEDDNKKFIAAVISIINQIETELDNVLLLESEKEQGYYWAFDTKELTRGSLKERYDAYEIAVRNNILQVDEIRREEDYEPLGFNFIKLGLQDVLLNPETMDVFTPNTGQTKNLLTGEERAEELRGWITKGGRHILIGDDEGGSSGGAGGGRRLYHHDPDTGGGSGKSIDKSAESDIIKSGKNYGEYRGQLDVPYEGQISSKDLDEFNKKALNSIMEETGLSEKDARVAQSAIIEWCGDDYKSFTNGQQKDKEKIINDCLSRMGAYDGEIQRGMNFSNAADGAEFINAEVGKTISMKSVSAWSNDSGVAARYAGKSGSDCDSVILICDKNKSAAGVQHISKWGTMEAEVLSPSNAKWEVTEKTTISKYDYLKNEVIPKIKIPPKKKIQENRLIKEETELKSRTITILKVKEV